jgi:predicted ATPase/DNA-binding SARP family transcriptional activator
VLRYRLLGPLEVADDDRPIAVPSAQQRLLLTMLLLEAGRTVHAGALVDGLWGDHLPSDPAAALRTQVSRLRRRLGARAGELLTDDVGYRLVVGEGCLDTLVFERLLAEGRVEEALALWRGPALGEFADRDFAAAAAARLDELRLGAREDRAAKALAEGSAHVAVADLEPLLAQHPERERARQLLMEALYRVGRQTDALTVFDAWRRELVEHGLEPGPALVELERRILQHQFPAAGRTFPAPVSSFVGREHDITTAATRLGAARVVTLCGPGGVGKTRLALELSRRLSDRYPDGVRFCDLSTSRRPSQVDRAAAAAVGVPDAAPRHPGDQLADQLVDRLASRRLLLVLDNCEHLLHPVARLVDRIVGHTDGITVLATSRERLGADGEVVQPVEPLDAPAATELFIDRARAVDPTFALDESSVQRICSRLDRLPLAIELAAACMNATTASELVDALDDPLGLLTSGSRATARHASLGAVIDWSYNTLSSEERAAFDRFAVFAGRVDADAAVLVTGATLGVLRRLVDRSLLSASRANVTQYSMLETLRDYAMARLDEQGELDVARRAHASWAVGLAEEAAAHLSGPEEPGWAARVARHVDELRAAHVWLVGHDPEAALRLSAALHPWAFWRGRSEVFRMAEVAGATASTASPLWADVVSSAAVGAWQRGDLAAAEAGAQAAARHRRGIEVLADVAFLRGDLTRARSLFLQAAAQAEAAGDTLQVVWDLGSAALALHYGGQTVDGEPARVRAIADRCGSPSARAFACFVIGEVDANVDELRTAMELAEQVGSDFLHNLAVVSLAAATARQGDTTPALDYYEQAIRTWQHVGAWSPLWITLRTLIRVLADLDLPADAATLHGAARRPRTGPAPYGADAAMMEETATTLLRRLGHDAFDAHVTHGADLADDEVVKFALQAVRRAREIRQGTQAAIGDHARSRS